MSKFKSIIKKLYYDMRIRFLFVGALNTLVGFGIDALACYLFQTYTSLTKEVYILLGTIIGTVIGAVHSYFWNKYFTFRSKKKSWAEVLRFSLVYLVCVAYSYFAQLGLIRLFNVEEGSIYFYIIKFAVLVIQVIVSWFGQKYFGFKKGKSNNLQEEETAIEEDKNE